MIASSKSEKPLTFCRREIISSMDSTKFLNEAIIILFYRERFNFYVRTSENLSELTVLYSTTVLRTSTVL